MLLEARPGQGRGANGYQGQHTVCRCNRGGRPGKRRQWPSRNTCTQRVRPHPHPTLPRSRAGVQRVAPASAPSGGLAGSDSCHLPGPRMLARAIQLEGRGLLWGEYLTTELLSMSELRSASILLKLAAVLKFENSGDCGVQLLRMAHRRLHASATFSTGATRS